MQAANSWLKSFVLYFVPVNGFHGKRRQTNSDVFSPAFVWRGVADPLASVSDHRLSGRYVDRPILMFDPQRTFKNHGELIEGRSLSRFGPSRGAAHVRGAGGAGLGIGPR